MEFKSLAKLVYCLLDNEGMKEQEKSAKLRKVNLECKRHVKQQQNNNKKKTQKSNLGYEMPRLKASHCPTKGGSFKICKPPEMKTLRNAPERMFTSLGK